ncbi:hypothetical protein H5410_057674 [Solanum commersonii]|uniref:Uncharacterized protein n=1 Tax=Solanum commersonii TaxID=4109 RepID=A0A9J5WQV6_SOLCO|nr:hypothetical protein H5410_057674 [Solanum commersonii]
MTSFEHNVMVALYWGGKIITDMSEFRYTECARMIISMSTSTNYVELVGLLHEKMITNSENIHMDISGKYPCSIQESIVQPPFQQLSMHGHQSFGEDSSSQIHIDNSHRDYEASDESSEEDEPSKDGDESEPDEDINDIKDFSQNGVNLHNHEQGVSEMQNHDIPYFKTLENDEDIFISKEKLKRGIMIWSLHKNKELMVVTSTKSLWVVRYCKFYNLLGCLWFLRGRKVEDNLWKIGKYIENHRCETEGISHPSKGNVEAHEYLMKIPLDKWTISHDDGKRWGVLTTNLLELFNGVLKKARSAMVRFSLEQTVERYTHWSQIVHQLVEKMNYGPGENYVATYSGSFLPIGHEAYWSSLSFRMRINEFYRRPNRPRTIRIPNEIDNSYVVYERASGLCRQTEHDKCRCPNHN